MDRNRRRMCGGAVEKLCYGMGHVYNDLCAAMWFSYTLFYLQIVLQMESKTAGILVMIGQVVDSLATPVAGWAVDRTGTRRACHLAGTVAVAAGFTAIFAVRPGGAWAAAYYAAVISLFQVGWALAQIAHLSIIPEMAPTHAHTADLTAIRYTASVCCSITVYLITLLILKTAGPGPSTIGPDDFYKFKEIALIITAIGALASLAFYCGTLTRNQVDYESIPESETENPNGLLTHGDVTHFLKSSITYKVALMYMASRLFTTLNLIYIPLYLDERESNEMNHSDDGIRRTIASVPLVSFIASFLASLFLKCRHESCNDKLVYLVGTVLALVASAWIGWMGSGAELHAIAAVIGVSGSATMVASLCLTAEFVKSNGYGGGSVYSTVTFTDKLISGGVVLIVQNLQCSTPRQDCPNFYQHVLAYVGTGVGLIGLISLASLNCNGKRTAN